MLVFSENVRTAHTYADPEGSGYNQGVIEHSFLNNLWYSMTARVRALDELHTHIKFSDGISLPSLQV